MRSIGLLTFMIPVGFASGAGIYMANSIGEGKPRVAMQYYKVVLCFSLFVTLIQILALYYGLELIIKAFTD